MTATYIHSRKKTPTFHIVLRSLTVLYFIGLAIVIAYLWMFTQNRYSSVSAFKISRQDSAAGEAGLAQLVLPGISDSSSADSQVAIGFITSVNMLVELENEFHLVDHYSCPKKDFVFRLDPKAPLEERLRYYRKRINAHYDKETGLTMLSVDTFDTALSKRVAEAVLEKSEKLINKLNQEVADQRLDFVNEELKRSTEHVEAVNAELLAFQNKHNIISPNEIISGNLKAVQELRMSQLRMTADLDSLLRDSPGSPRIEALKSNIRSTNELIGIEMAKLSGGEQDRLNQLLIQFKQLELKLEFAIKLRTGVQTLLEKTRVDSIAQSRFFSVVQPPYLPEDIAIPRREYATVTILVVGILIFVIVRALTNSTLERTP
jgi:capsular polysaccharide transport system permease protein